MNKKNIIASWMNNMKKQNNKKIHILKLIFIFHSSHSTSKIFQKRFSSHKTIAVVNFPYIYEFHISTLSARVSNIHRRQMYICVYKNVYLKLSVYLEHGST